MFLDAENNGVQRISHSQSVTGSASGRILVHPQTGYKWQKEEDAPGYKWKNKKALEEAARAWEMLVGKERKGQRMHCCLPSFFYSTLTPKRVLICGFFPRSP